MNIQKGIRIVLILLAASTRMAVATQGVPTVRPACHCSQYADAAHSSLGVSVTPGSHAHTNCSWCGGTGRCYGCHGTGQWYGKTCHLCAGSGRCSYCSGSGHFN